MLANKSDVDGACSPEVIREELQIEVQHTLYIDTLTSFSPSCCEIYLRCLVLLLIQLLCAQVLVSQGHICDLVKTSAESGLGIEEAGKWITKHAVDPEFDY